jgi:hypothetical protein
MTPTSNPPAASQSTPGTPQQHEIFDKLDRAAAAASPRGSRHCDRSRESLRGELDLYLEEPVIDRKTDCPFEWWRQNKSRFPAVALLARKLLCVPAMSVPSERLFSKAGDVITKKRNSLSPAKVEMIIFLMEN